MKHFTENCASVGALLLTQGDPQGAAVLLEAAVNASPTRADYWRAYGAALQRSARLPAARIAYEKAASLEPKDVATWTNLGEVCLGLADFVAASAAFAQACERDPQGKHPAGMRARVLCLKASRDLTKQLGGPAHG
jgi:Flp pilus assembly protein TadD